MLIVFLSTVLIVLIALVGNLIIRKIGHSHEIIMRLVGFSSGSLLGGVFFHLLPEMVAEKIQNFSFGLVLLTILTYLLIERFLFWRHSHDDIDHFHGQSKSIGYINLLGDTVHNFIDGLVIFGAYSIDFNFGLVTTLAVALHEIPQEMGDLGVLLHGGFSKRKALFLNFGFALFAIAGAVVGLLIGGTSELFLRFILPFTAGGFLYIANADLFPELHKNSKSGFDRLLHFLFILAGIGVMIGLLGLEIG